MLFVLLYENSFVDLVAIIIYLLFAIIFGCYLSVRSNRVVNSKALTIAGLFVVLLKYNGDYNDKMKKLLRNFVREVCGDGFSDSVDNEVNLLLKKRNLNVHKRSFDAHEKLAYNERVNLVKLLFDISIENGGIYPAELDILKIIMERTLKQVDYNRFMYEYEKYFIVYKKSSFTSQSPCFSQRIVDAYAVLGLKPNTNFDEVKKVYRHLIFLNHPDRFDNKETGAVNKAVERTKELNIAYDLIEKSVGRS